MKVERNDSELVTVLRFEGDIDGEGVKALRVMLLDCLKERRAHVVVNLTGVREISYMGVGVLMERQRQLRAMGGGLMLVGLSVCVRRVLDMASVTHMFSIHDTEDQAIERFREAA